jgi:selenium metabolism protein YedF
MEKTVDLRGLVCPEPVLKTKKMLDDGSVQQVEALVESEVNVNNLQRLARSLKMHFRAEPEQDYYRVTINREGSSSGDSQSGTSAAHPVAVQPGHAHEAAPASGSSKRNETEVGTVLFLAKDKFGDGDPEFSNQLLNMFLQTLLQSGHQPRAILMANAGVKLLAPDSPSFKVLDDFKNAGVEVLACGLCVEFYGLKGKIPVEQITNMFAICEFLMVADKVIQP